ncbi:MAG: Gfo/Idh/MocA family oxidoreductase [Coprobacillus sp.]|nr:Gfo/Idh/MocA family oxidoreductase [Coprobacillus sp.]
MKLGITGCGMIVHDLFNFIHDVEGVELEAMASIPAEYEKVQELAKANHVKKTYECYEDMLADNDVDVIYLGVPNHLHYAMCKQALEAGKHVICEKPFTSHIKELEELNQLAKEKELMLLEAISTQYLPNVLKIKEMLDEVGNVKILTANYSQYSSRYNAFKEGNILPAFDYTKSGGALMDLNIYNIHFMVALFGEPQKVQYQANIEKGIDTSGIMTLDYGSFKAVLIGAKDCKAPISTNIQGDKGCINITTPANNLRGFKLLRNDGTEEEMNLQGDTHRMYYEFVEFVKIIENKDYQRVEEMMKKSLIAMTIATKARQSAGVVFTADENL